MSVNVQVLDEHGLPVKCSVAAVRTSTQTILSLTPTNSEGVAVINESGTWYPRPMVSPMYKATTKMVVLNDQHGACYDYVVDSGGGGTHPNLFGTNGALIQAATDATSRAIWVCPGHVETTTASCVLPTLAANQSITVAGANRRTPTIVLGITPAIKVSSADVLGRLRFERMGFVTANEWDFNGSFIWSAGSGGNIPQIEMWDVLFGPGGNTWGSIVDAGNSNLAGFSLKRTTFNGLSLLKNTQGTANAEQITWDDCDFDVVNLVDVGALASTTEGGQKITVANNRLKVSGYGWRLRGTTGRIVISNNIIDHNGDDDFLYFTAGVSQPFDITVIGNNYSGLLGGNNTTFFRANQGIGTVTNLVISDNTLLGPGGTSKAIVINGSAAIDSVFINGYRNWGTNVSGAGARTTISGPVSFSGAVSGLAHSGLTGLTSPADDHTQYPLLAGRGSPLGNNLLGYFRVGSAAVPANTTAGDLIIIRSFWNNDSHFSIRLSGTNPTMFFDSDSYIQYDRTNKMWRHISNNVEQIQVNNSGILDAGYLRVGSLVAPTNVTAGDLTGIRGFIGADAALLTGLTFQVAGKLGISGKNSLRFYNAGNTFYSELVAAAVGNNIQYVLPLTDPTAGQVLSASAPAAGVSTLSWIAAGAGAGGSSNAGDIWAVLA